MDLHSLGGRLILLNILRRNQIQSCMERRGLHPGQLPLLEDVLLNPGTAQQDVAARLMITPASVAQSVKRMCREGLIEKHADAENARRNSLYATDAGARVAAACHTEIDRLDSETFAGMTDEETDALAALLDRTINNLTDGRELPFIYPCWKEKPTK